MSKEGEEGVMEDESGEAYGKPSEKEGGKDALALEFCFSSALRLSYSASASCRASPVKPCETSLAASSFRSNISGSLRLVLRFRLSPRGFGVKR